MPSVSYLAPTYLDLGVHKDTISVAVLAPDRDGPEVDRIPTADKWPARPPKIGARRRAVRRRAGFRSAQASTSSSILLQGRYSRQFWPATAEFGAGR